MSPTIERIEVAGPERRARRLYLSGEEKPLTTSDAVVTTLSLQAGDEVDRADLTADLAEATEACLRERALRIIGYRERSSAEVTRRLVDDGYPRTAVQELVGRYVELGLIDDARFAGMWARSRCTAGFGRRRVARELADRHVDPEVATAALDEVFAEDSEVERATMALRGRRPADRADKERLIARLVRRGFSLDVARRALGLLEDDSGLD